MALTINAVTVALEPQDVVVEDQQKNFVTRKRAINGGLLVDKITIGTKRIVSFKWPTMTKTDYNFWRTYDSASYSVNYSDTQMSISGTFWVTVSEAKYMGDLRQDVTVILEEV